MVGSTSLRAHQHPKGGAPAFPGKLQPLWEAPAFLRHHPWECNSIPLGYQHSQGGNRIISGVGGTSIPKGIEPSLGATSMSRTGYHHPLEAAAPLEGQLATAAASPLQDRTGVPLKHPADARAPLGAGTHPAGSRHG